ncbi:electron transfer flavoprotein-ubiquinone oxidoreductase [Burkholderia multivorans]|uniref:electron transfer flavoprotein-ubiquinone oxidoreductase n=1 Tax=Burkholderia multivorans TaxID=87883 RepID=UPI00143EB6B4|nr:electron transfer flavoprotein-ubiquinone oxidoreductase [Burkholderia multivorans]MBU9468173.1 electron transfer flavoprotein-ubiquinone oxidoreductase [Burkholderia multivorans]MCA8129250.1 electron transfer flavoprotein-ubiquinone oxidoreductase [Burkholderia multivorans]QIX17476.1 electron transfer flavoprotein-ubiquinone oxidoreductase [Burkholderia multivorans]
MTPASLIEQYGPRESMEYDVVIVGGGPAGLSAAIRLKQLAAEKGTEIGVCVLEKGSEIGAHILSGAVMDPRALTELFPDWKERDAPLNVEVTEDRFLFLSEKSAVQTPNWALPDNFKNHGNYVISLGNVTRWLGQQAEALGVEIFPGFPAAEILYNDDGSVKGVATGNMGVGKDGEPTENFQLGMELHAKYTLFAEGCRGHLGRQLIAKFKLDANADPQAYGIGIKELWEIDPAKHKPGLVIHTAGWPLKPDTYGGSFLYHMDNNQVVVGFVVGLGYTNPYLSPFEEFQRYKTHPSIRAFLEGGKRVSYGARAITAGGLMSLPKTVFPGGALIGDDAGFLNASRIKGSHAAIKTGMLAADAAFDAVQAGRQSDELNAYPDAFRQSWLYTELYRARNFKQWMAKGLYLGTLMVGIEQKLMGGNVPWTLHHKHADHEMLKPASQCEPIVYPKPDGKLTFDRLSSVFISNTNHEENQPAHLTLKDPSVPVNVNLRTYAGPEGRFCPAAVYEFVKNDDGSDRLVINAQNCVHCKTCDIKDPTQNIVWVTPEGGGGPNYPNM